VLLFLFYLYSDVNKLYLTWTWSLQWKRQRAVHSVHCSTIHDG